MNYIKLLAGFFEMIAKDDRLNPTHVSMYMAIFQFWNINHFQNPISISRNQVMLVSKISSTATYHKCMKELNEYGYLEYLPSFNPYKGSLVRLFNIALEEDDLLPEKKSKYGKNLSLFDLKNEPIIVDKSEQDNTKIQSGDSVDNLVIHTKNQTGYSAFNLTKIDTGTKQALVPSINVINVIKENIYNKENEILKIEIPKKNNAVSVEKKEKSCAKKEKDFAPSGGGVKAPPNDVQNTSSTECLKAPSGVGGGVGVVPTLEAVLEYFLLKEYASLEAEKFFNYFESVGWLIGGKAKMKNWNAAARNWVLNAKGYCPPPKRNIPIASTLHTIKNKNYNEPL